MHNDTPQAKSKFHGDLNVTFSWKKAVTGQNPFSLEKPVKKVKPKKVRPLTTREHGIWQQYKESEMTIKNFCINFCLSVRQFEKIRDKVDSIGFDDEFENNHN